MNWDAIGAAGETLGAIIVLITLIYLAIQMRQSNRLMQAQHRETNRSAVAQVFDPVLRDKQLAAVIEQSRQDPTVLDEADQRRVLEQVRNELLLAQSIFVRARLMGEKRTEPIGARLASAAIRDHVAARRLWQDTEWEPDFADAVEDLLAAEDD